MILEHYPRDDAFRFDASKSYENKRDDKPTGFWVSVKGPDDWPSWCRAESFRTEALERDASYVHLDESANILHIRNSAELNAFDLEYGLEMFPGEPLLSQHRYKIDWERLKGEYDGIIIAPYLWEMRLGNLSWYYSWDVASGCIWNLNVINGLTRIIRDPHAELEKLKKVLAYNASTMLERADNQMRFGTPDPTGGAGKLPLSFDQYHEPQFEKWVKQHEDSLSGPTEPSGV